MGERDLMGAAEMLRSGECQLCPYLRAERAGTGDTRTGGGSVTQCYNSPPLLFRYSVSGSVTLYSTDRRYIGGD